MPKAKKGLRRAKNFAAAQKTTTAARRSPYQTFFIGAVLTLGAFTVGMLSGISSSSSSSAERTTVEELHDPNVFPSAWQADATQGQVPGQVAAGALSEASLIERDRDASMQALQERMIHLRAQVAEKRAARGAPKQQTAEAMPKAPSPPALVPSHHQSGLMTRFFGSPPPPATAGGCVEEPISEDCRTHIDWAMEVGIHDAKAGEWYPQLTPESSFKEFQAELINKGCPQPCLEGANEAVPAAPLPPLPPLPPPLPDKWHNTPDLVILVLSGRDNRRQRDAVRDTWQNGYPNVFFIVGSFARSPILCGHMLLPLLNSHCHRAICTLLYVCILYMVYAV